MIQPGEKKCCIIGGGPSLRGFDFRRLANLYTICVNTSVRDTPNPKVFITADTRMCCIAASTSFWKTGVSTTVFVVPPGGFNAMVTKRYWPKFTKVIHSKRHRGGFGLSYDDFATGFNSGYCALQYAIIEGFTDIDLLGFDCHTHGGEHYHNRTFLIKDDLPKFIECFKESLTNLPPGVKVWSCSPTSKLNQWIPFREFNADLE